MQQKVQMNMIDTYKQINLQENIIVNLYWPGRTNDLQVLNLLQFQKQ